MASQVTSTPVISIRITMTIWGGTGGQMGLLRVRQPSKTRMSFSVSDGNAVCSLWGSSTFTVMVGNWAWTSSATIPIATKVTAVAIRAMRISDRLSVTIVSGLALYRDKVSGDLALR